MAKITFTISDNENDGSVNFEFNFDPQIPPEDQWEDGLTKAQQIALYIAHSVIPNTEEKPQCPFKQEN